MSYVEHANVTVRDLDRAVDFIQTALPDFAVRGRGMGLTGPWLHIGTERSYVAFQQEHPEAHGHRRAYVDSGINHVGFVVEDAGAVARRLREAGYREGFKAPEHAHRRRIYFYDRDDIEWEFVQYTSDDAALRNDYEG